MAEPQRYYFASRYSRHPELRAYRAELLELLPGATVTSRWIDCHNEELEQSFSPEALNADPTHCWKYGAHDIEDVEAADTLVSFTGPGGKGGRHIEHGYAMALRKRIVIVGQREHIFHCSPNAELYASWQEFLIAESEIRVCYGEDHGYCCSEAHVEQMAGVSVHRDDVARYLTVVGEQA